MIEVRPERLGDGEDLAIIEGHADKVLRKTYRPTKAGLRNNRRILKRTHRLMACANDKVVGTVQYYLENDGLRLLGLAVHRDFRRQGIARVLVEYVCRLSKQYKFSALGLSTIKETGNIAVFERLGFQIVAEHSDGLVESVDGQPLTDVEMKRFLTWKTARG